MTGQRYRAVRVLVSVLMACALLPTLACDGTTPDEDQALRQTLDEIASQVVEMRELAPKGDVEYEFITTEELRERLTEDFQEENPKEEIRTTQEVLALLDLMPEDQDLGSVLLDVLSEQVIGFYDDETKKLYVVSDGDEMGALEKMTFAHEYAHALQDQHFDLGSLPLETEDESDVALAALSLVEGDAQAVTFRYFFEHLSLDEQRSVLEESMQADMEMLESAPRFVREELAFPYNQGLELVLRLDGWEGINQAYADPPRSTEQVLHPEKYLERDDPQEVSLPDLAPALGEGWSEEDTDILGELYVRIYLETYLTEARASEAAAGWDGDRYLYLKSTGGDRVLAWRTTWDSPADALEYFSACAAFVEEKSDGAWDLCFHSEMGRMWRAEGQGVYLGANGSDALLIIATGADEAQTVAAGFSEFPAVDSACP